MTRAFSSPSPSFSLYFNRSLQTQLHQQPQHHHLREGELLAEREKKDLELLSKLRSTLRLAEHESIPEEVSYSIIRMVGSTPRPPAASSPAPRS